MPRRGGAQPFRTAIGTCGLAWSGRGIDRVLLPARDEAATREQLAALGRPLSGDAPPEIRKTVRQLTAHLAGRAQALRDAPLDLRQATGFGRRIYRALRKVAPGKTITYGELAHRAGHPGSARAVGRVLGRNPLPLLIPCHRVLPANGGWGGFTAEGGPALKARLLFIEGVIPDREVALGIAMLRRKDPKLRRIIDHVGPYLPRLGRAGDPYEALVGAIIYQQLSGKAAATIAARVRALTPGDGYPRAAEIQDLSDTCLRGAGLSRQKLSYLKDLAQHVARGDLDLRRLPRMDDEAVSAALQRVRGIGRWSADMFLLFHLGRLDVFPVDDLGIRKAVQNFWPEKDLPAPEAVLRRGEAWRPYRSLATWYLWRGLDTDAL